VPASRSGLEEEAGFWVQAYAHPDKVAIIGPSERAVSFGELVARVNRLSHLLRSFGLEAGDHVSYLLPNRAEVLEVVLACFQLGLIYTPINHHLLPDEVTYIVEDSKAKVFIADDRFADLAVAAADAASIDTDYRLSVGAIPTFRPMVTEAAPFPDTLPTDRKGGSVMMYTSGTTGKPKGVMRGAMVSDIVSMVEFMLAPARLCGRSDADVYLSQCPLYFSGPISNCTQVLHLGATAILMDHWTPEECLALIDRHRVTASMMVPTMFHRLLALPPDVRSRYDVSSLRRDAVLQGAGMCPIDDKWAMLEWWGPVFSETYGGTEGRYTSISSEEWVEHPGSVGRAAEGMTARVSDDDGRECDPCQVGMVYGKLTHGDGLGTVYFNSPEKTAASLHDGYFTLGDMGYLDEDGWLYLADRRFDLIVSGGVNIYPAEVEPVLLKHPAVVDAAVIGVPNAEWGQEVKAVVQPVSIDDAGPALEADIIAFAQQHLARYKCPRSVDFRETLPRLPSGKLYKRHLRDEYATNEESQQEASK